MEEDIKSDLSSIAFTHPFFSDIVENTLNYIEQLEKENKNYNKAYNLGKAFINKQWEQKIKDKIEEYKKLVEDFEKTDNTGRFKRTNSIDYYKLEAFKELLQERKDK